jgi:hypothetical protein
MWEMLIAVGGWLLAIGYWRLAVGQLIANVSIIGMEEKEANAFRDSPTKRMLCRTEEKA